MAAFPDILTNQPIRIRWQHRTNLRESKSAWGTGREIRKRLSLYPTCLITLAPERATAADARSLINFIKARSGSYETFTWIAPFSDVYTGLFVGVADGVNAGFNLPFATGSSMKVYLDGVEQNPTDYTITQDIGLDGVDKLVFDVAPADGAVVTADCTGQLAVRCRFAADDQEIGCLTTAYTMIEDGVELQGIIEDGLIEA